MGEEAKAAGGAEEEKGTCAKIGDGLASVFFAILDVLNLIFKSIYWVLR